MPNPAQDRHQRHLPGENLADGFLQRRLHRLRLGWPIARDFIHHQAGDLVEDARNFRWSAVKSRFRQFGLDDRVIEEDDVL